ncbi:LytTR family transcriptional regulator [Kaistia sp. 32K]|uniref:DUF4159 domain-containing protein n=1 Tax=Kaistia sp. 32K TaxID=2795690 RepID=UPI00191634AA|nr:DUF4159 domain-containing protein [Kaistia sp. 32K]BCP54680.1 LytTR family transcriptional regulator [Kaistia sp. 32K]
MIAGLPLAFGAPLVLTALVLLPAIWWLLKLTPPRPRLESFPPTRILTEIAKRDEQPARSPWWLTALRLLLAGLVILALAAPIWRPTGESAPGEGPLLLVIDNDWAAARDWSTRIDTARRIVELAERSGRPIGLIATAEPPNQQFAPTDGDAIRTRLDALVPRPYATDRSAIATALQTAAASASFGGVAWLSNGLGGPDADDFSRFLETAIRAPVTIYGKDGKPLLGLAAPVATADALTLSVLRGEGPALTGTLVARDMKGRSIGEAPFAFKANELRTDAAFALPSELRNEIVRVEIAGNATAGAVQLLDDRFKRRRIGVISGASSDNAQPLLSPLYYISRAVQPFADVIEPRDANAANAVPQMIEAGAAVIAMADIGTLTPDVEQKLADWVEAGGTLLRFAGPRLAAASGETDTLIPVRLREGGRVLGGSLSWSSPQPLASFSAQSPFAGLAIAPDIEVRRQVLAEPDGNLPSRTWAALGDGTPLVTAAPLGKGWLILFHVTADASWSNLPLSGTFVEMLRRIAAFASVPQVDAARAVEGATTAAMLPPYRLLDGFGHFVTSDPLARPLSATGPLPAPSRDHPPGLYGADDGFRAVNVLAPDATLPPFNPAATIANAEIRPYPTTAPTDLSPYLLLAALACLIADALAVLWLNGGLRMRARAAALVIACLTLGHAFAPPPARADAASDQFAMDAVNKSRLAYVRTGNQEIDDMSEAGLAGLSRALSARTAMEPDNPLGVDVAKDELSFFPLLYWPIDPNAPMPDSATLAKIDAYMKQGGSILFDTRDELERAPGTTGFGGTPAAERLRTMLSGLDIPPLEPVPSNHVLTKAFYLLEDFPGRYSGGPLWVEASPPEDDAAAAARPARPGDGVSSILITENDMAAAWATDPDGRFLVPTIPPDPRQRELAYRTGINIVMYTLTGNYKADQVHVPALLERLGQ